MNFKFLHIEILMIKKLKVILLEFILKSPELAINSFCFLLEILEKEWAKEDCLEFVF